MPLLRFVVTALALLDDRTAHAEPEGDSGAACTSAGGDRDPQEAAGPARTSSTLRQRVLKTRAPAEEALQCRRTAVPEDDAGRGDADSREATAHGTSGVWPPRDSLRGRKRDSRGRLMPCALLRQPVRLADFPELEGPVREAEACNLGHAQVPWLLMTLCVEPRKRWGAAARCDSPGAECRCELVYVSLVTGCVVPAGVERRADVKRLSICLAVSRSALAVSQHVSGHTP